MFSNQKLDVDSVESFEADGWETTATGYLKHTPDKFQKIINDGYNSVEKELKQAFKNDSKDMSEAINLLKKLHRETNAYLDNYLSKAEVTDNFQIECMIRAILMKDITCLGNSNDEDNELLIKLISTPRMLFCIRYIM